MDVGITKLSSKGQIVIPYDLRKDLKEGEKFLVIREESSILIKKYDSLSNNFKEDLEFAKRTEEALNRVQKGKFVKISEDDLDEELSTW